MTVHEKINVRTYLSKWEQLSDIGKRVRLPYYRVLRPYKMSAIHSECKSPLNVDVVTKDKQERFEFKF